MRVLTVGMLVCDIPLSPVPADIFKLEVSQIEVPEITTGGDALNVATTLAKLGIDATVVGKVGKDSYGKIVMSQANENGVDTRYIKEDEEYGTAVSYLLLEKETGEKHALSSTGIYEALTNEDVPDEALEDAQIVFFGSAFQFKRMDEGGTAQLFKRAHQMGKLTAMDTAMAVVPESGEEMLEKLKPVLQETDIFFPSYEEAKFLTGYENPEDIAAALQKFGIKICGIKMGARGSFVTDYQQAYYIGTCTDFQVVDTTGAGDSFIGGFLCGIAKGWKLEECAVFASAVAGHNVAVKGATKGVPDFETIMNYLERSNIPVRTVNK